jgi:hypothetical protein
VALHKSVFKAFNRFDYCKAHPDEADLPASASRGEFSEEFIAEVLAAEEECEMGHCTRFENVEELLASLDR